MSNPDPATQNLPQRMRVLSEINHPVRERHLMAMADVLREGADEIERLRNTPHFVVVPSLRNQDGQLCGTCDGTHRHEHARVRCSRCSKEGLRENWPFDCCGVDAALAKDIARAAKERDEWMLTAVESVVRAKKQRDELAELVKRARTDSCVTTSDDPGCFFCDQANECSKDCPAAAALAKLEKP